MQKYIKKTKYLYDKNNTYSIKFSTAVTQDVWCNFLMFRNAFYFKKTYEPTKLELRYPSKRKILFSSFAVIHRLCLKSAVSTGTNSWDTANLEVPRANTHSVNPFDFP